MFRAGYELIRCNWGFIALESGCVIIPESPMIFFFLCSYWFKLLVISVNIFWQFLCLFFSDLAMAFTFDQKLKLLNICCQAYAFFFSVLALLIFFNLTLPDVSGGDLKTLCHLKLFTCFLYLNIWGNYVCGWHRAKLSIVRPSKTDPTLGLDLTQDAAGTSSSSSHLSLNHYNSKRSNWPHGYHMKEDEALVNNRENDLWSQPNFCYDEQNLTAGKTDSNHNNSNKYSSVFVYSDGCDGRYCGAEHHKKVVVDVSGGRTAWGSEFTGRAAAGWTRCRDCSMTVPPRAKHCPLCRHCILKRDHHCFFLGCCVGFHNQRFFIAFCLYAGIGGIFSSIATLLYLGQHFEVTGTWGCFVYVLPFALFVWVRGQTSGLMVAMVIFLYWSILTSLYCCYYFIIQIFLVCRGQTQYECLKEVRTYQGSVVRNIQSVFGRYWLLGFIMPSPFLGYQGDGSDWGELVFEDKIV